MTELTVEELADEVDNSIRCPGARGGEYLRNGCTCHSSGEHDSQLSLQYAHDAIHQMEAAAATLRAQLTAVTHERDQAEADLRECASVAARRYEDLEVMTAERDHAIASAKHASAQQNTVIKKRSP